MVERKVEKYFRCIFQLLRCQRMLCAFNRVGQAAQPFSNAPVSRQGGCFISHKHFLHGYRGSHIE